MGFIIGVFILSLLRALQRYRTVRQQPRRHATTPAEVSIRHYAQSYCQTVLIPAVDNVQASCPQPPDTWRQLCADDPDLRTSDQDVEVRIFWWPRECEGL